MDKFYGWDIIHTQGVISPPLTLKFIFMSRLKQRRIIDNLIHNIQIIKKSQCSLSELDAKILDEAIVRLTELRGKKGKTNEQILVEVAKIIELLVKFFK